MQQQLTNVDEAEQLTLQKSARTLPHNNMEILPMTKS